MVETPFTMVCSGQLDLYRAQHATDRIAVYKKYFHTNKLLPVQLESGYKSWSESQEHPKLFASARAGYGMLGRRIRSYRFFGRLHLRPPSALCGSDSLTTSGGHSSFPGHSDDIPDLSAFNLRPSRSLCRRNPRPSRCGQCPSSSTLSERISFERGERRVKPLNFLCCRITFLLQLLNYPKQVSQLRLLSWRL